MIVTVSNDEIGTFLLMIWASRNALDKAIDARTRISSFTAASSE
jgi:hypothetical protein